VSGRLKLRRGVVVAEDPLEVEVDDERRAAWADTALLGEMREGDEVVVNTAALDLGLGSGGFDVVHVNLTRGLSGGGGGAEHVMKLNYTSLQHPVEPTERRCNALDPSQGTNALHRAVPVLVLPLHGHLAPAAWAAQAAGRDGAPVSGGTAGAQRGAPRIGYIQTGGGALPGSLSRDVATLRERELLCGHITAAPAYGGEHEALSVAGALDAATNSLGWDAVLAGPGPGIIGSETPLGHGGMAALDTAHAALALGMPTLLSPRLSAADPRERHRGVSHHTLVVLDLLLAPVEVVIPEAEEEVAATLETAGGGRHGLQVKAADVEGYTATGLPSRTMGRGIEDDPLFFAAPLAAGAALAGAVLRRKG
jgi:Protein of unknown function (DUF3866)